jgi:putative chitinase
MIDAGFLSALYLRPMSAFRADTGPMNEAMKLAEINTDERIADWLAQVGHESGKLVYRREIWGPTASQKRYDRDFTQPWPRSPAAAKAAQYTRNRLAYTLGNSEAGYGKRYMGRGWIQTTGLTNYIMTTQRIREIFGNVAPDFVANPEKLAEVQWAAFSAAVFWKAKGLNRYSDSGQFETQTRRVNGGLNGYADRQMLRARGRMLIQFAR